MASIPESPGIIPHLQEALDMFPKSSHPSGEGVFMPSCQAGKPGGRAPANRGSVQNQVLCPVSGSSPAVSEPTSASASLEGSPPAGSRGWGLSPGEGLEGTLRGDAEEPDPR